MTGLVMPHRSIPHACKLQVAAGSAVSVGLASLAGLAAIDWSRASQQAVGALGLAGLVGGSVVGGVIYAINKWDQVAIDRRKKYDEADKVSLSEQLSDLMEQSKAAAERAEVDGKAMRASLHELRNEAHLAKAENYELRTELGTLRGQFMSVSKQLHDTDLLLHAAREEMHGVSEELRKTRTLLADTERDRNALRAQLDGLNRAQADQGTRLQALETGSVEGYQVPPNLLDDTPPHGIPTFKGGPR